MSVEAPLRILALLEANSISGTAKAVLEMAYEAKADFSSHGQIQIVVANFMRDGDPTENALTKALKSAQISFFPIREKGRFDGSVLSQIHSLLKRNESDLVWTNSVKSHFLVRQANVPTTCSWVAYHHGYTATDFKMRLYNQLDRFSLRKADRVVTVCKPFAEQINARGVPADRICIQHMPIRRFTTSPDDAARLRTELRLLPDAKVILSIGRLSREKGHKDLIAAFAQLREQRNDDRLRLVIVGDGPERANLLEAARHYDVIDQSVFAGHRDDAKRFYGIADVFALPSYSEGTPNVLLEAMAAGVPVVTTQVGGIPELATNGRDALLIPPSRPAEMAEALGSILQSEELRNTLTLAAGQVVAAHSPRLYFEAMRQIFRQAAAR